MVGPELYYVYDGRMSPYEANRIEKWTHPPIKFFVRFYKLLIPCSSIFLCIPLGGSIILISLFVLTLFYLLRGVGRVRNPVYHKFITTLVLDLQRSELRQNYESTKSYDFDISCLPPLYHQNKFKLCPKISNLPNHHFDWLLSKLFSVFVYPGSVRFSFFRNSKNHAKYRYQLTTSYKGSRVKLQCNSRQILDTMYAVASFRRHNTLVIVCKGNYSFYESRGMTSWVRRGYPCIGWNHCGYGYSTGSPTGRQEKEAILTLVSYAVEVLGYPVENILLHGNSIGGFTACFASAAFPDIHGLILEATFDDISSLVPALVPRFLPRNLITRILRYCYDLDNISYLLQYRGPLTLIRKTEDILMRSEPRNLGSNRINFVLLEVMKQRYGDLFTSEDCFEGVQLWLSADSGEICEIEKDFDRIPCVTYLENYNSLALQETSLCFKKELALFIATQFLKNQNSPHSSYLSSQFYRPPTHIPSNN